MRVGGCSAGSSRGLRLDPFALPVRFSASDAAADGREREIELHCERVVLRRSVCGMRMALNMPLSAFSGVALRLSPEKGEAASIVLTHKDPSLILPLSVTTDADDAMADWHSWSRVLGLPLVVEEEEGAREVFIRVGQVRVSRPRPRRRRRSGLQRRRPSKLMVRSVGRITAATPVHRGEREIIART